MEEKVLVTIREVKEMLQLSSKYRYLDQIVYGKSALVKPVNPNNEVKKEYLYTMDELMDIISSSPFATPSYQSLIR